MCRAKILLDVSGPVYIVALQISSKSQFWAQCCCHGGLAEPVTSNPRQVCPHRLAGVRNVVMYHFYVAHADPGSALEITILIGNSRVYILLKFFKCTEDCALFRRLHCIRVGLEWLSHQMESTSPPRRPRLKTLKTMWNENKLNAEQKCTFLNTCIKDAQSGRSIKCSFREYTMRIVHILLWCFDLGKPSKF